MKRTILLILAGVALYSCQTNKSVLSANYIAGATYAGILPCEDCKGINQVVILDTGNTFKLSETYLGKEEPCQEKCGKWSVQNGKLLLYTDSTTIAQYGVAGNNLVHLAANTGKNSSSGQGMLTKKKFTRSRKINAEYLQGLDVVAFGTDASWSLDITHNKAIQFSVAGLSAPIAFSPVVPKLSGDSLIYNVVTANEKMQIIFSPGFCGDGDELYDYKVTVQFRGKTYNGCGAILNSEGTLDGTWLLQAFEGEGNNWNERPYLTIDLESKKFIGFTGCNPFVGSTRCRESFVSFSDINADAKECTAYNENDFITTLVKCNGFVINDGKLELRKDGVTLLTFKRKVSEDLSYK